MTQKYTCKNRRPQIVRPQRTRPARNSRSGVAAVELALVLPVFFLFVFGAVTFGGLVMNQNVLSAAAIDGARIASLQNASASQIVAAVESRLAKGMLKPGDATVTVTPVNPASGASGTPVTVKVAMAANRMTWLDCSAIGLGFDVTSEVSAEKE
jgi:Flp pilus assembly protein TadG